MKKRRTLFLPLRLHPIAEKHLLKNQLESIPSKQKQYEWPINKKVSWCTHTDLGRLMDVVLSRASVRLKKVGLGTCIIAGAHRKLAFPI